MRTYILSRNNKLYATRRLVEEGRKAGMKVNVVDTLKLSLLVNGQDSKIIYRDKEIKKPDIVIPRIGASITAFGGCIMVQMEQMNIKLLNSSDGMFNSRDKLRCTQKLSSSGIPVPRTLLLRRATRKDILSSDALNKKTILKEKIAHAVDMIGGAPCIFKLNKGTQGVGVILCKTMNDVFAQVDLMWKTKQDFILQEFIKESSGVDVRAFVVGDKVIASMKRESKTGDFRSNTHQGGEVSNYVLSDEASKMAVNAAKITGLNVAGVDMLLSNDSIGFKIIEINSSPGFEGLEAATNKNIAKEIINYSKNMIKGVR